MGKMENNDYTVQLLNTIEQTLKLNEFLKLLNLHSYIQTENRGVIIDNNKQIIGNTSLRKYMNFDDFCFNAELCHPYGGMRIKMDCSLKEAILFFQINRDGSHRLKGKMMFNKTSERIPFVSVEGLDIDSYEKEDNIQSISIQKKNQAFSYDNYKTGEELRLFRRDRLNKQKGVILSEKYKMQSGQYVEMTLGFSEDNERIARLNVYNRKTGELLSEQIEERMQKRANRQKQLQFITEELDPLFYERISKAISSYDDNGFNIVESAIETILCSQTDKKEEQSQEKRIIKEILLPNRIKTSIK